MPPKAANGASQQTWTLRFKKHKTTILLSVHATQSFDSIKKELLSSIKATGISHINGDSLPSDATDIIFGVLVEKNDPSQGWVDLEIPATVDGDDKSKGGQDSSVFNESPMGAGLEDAAVLAFRFQGINSTWDVIIPSYDEEVVSQDVDPDMIER